MTIEKIGRYEIQGEIGHGGMATVYHANDPSFGREVAIKILPVQLQHNPQFRERFQREARTIATLEHQGIVPVYDVGEENNTPYLVMRYMTGGTLSNHIPDNGMSMAEASRIITRLAGALDEAHKRGIVHRDLKPANILFDQYGEAYVSDFGIVKLTEESMVLTGSGVIGTPMYMSPEQASGKTVDGRSDIYSLGVILYEMITGKLPYEGETPMGIAVKHITEPVPDILAVRPNLPAEVRPVILKALSKEVDQRYQTAKALADDLAAVAEGKPSKAGDEIDDEKYYTMPHTMPISPVASIPTREVVRQAEPTAVASSKSEAVKEKEDIDALTKLIRMSVPIVAIVAIAAVSIALILVRPWEQAATTISEDATDEPIEPTPDSDQEVISEQDTDTASEGVIGLVDRELGNVDSLSVNIALGDSELTLQAAEEGVTSVKADFGGDPGAAVPETNILTLSGQETLRITQEEPPIFILGEDPMGDTHIMLPRTTPLNLTIDTGIGDAVIDLTHLNVNTLTLTGANGPTRVILPSASTISIYVQGTYADITFDVPEDISGLTIQAFEVIETLGVVRVNLPMLGGYIFHVNSSYGQVEFDIPDGLGVRVEARNEFIVVNNQDLRLKETEPRIWQTTEYDQLDQRMVIQVVSTSGTISVVP